MSETFWLVSLFLLFMITVAAITIVKVGGGLAIGIWADSRWPAVAENTGISPRLK